MTRTVVHFIESATFGGTETSLLYLLAQLDRERWRQVLFYRPESGLTPLLERAQQLQVKQCAIPWLRGPRSAGHLLELVQSLHAERPCILHVHLQWPLAGKAAFLAATLARVPAVVATAHLFLEQPWGRSIHWQQRLVARRVNRYIAVSGAIARQLVQCFHVSRSRLTVIHNAVEVNQFDRPCNPALRAQLTGGTARPVVLTVARLDRQKGQCYLLQAAAALPQALFVLAGDGPDRPMLEAQARELGIQDRVVFLGYRQDVADLLACCDIFVLPSLYEGLPVTILEALASGKPVIATAIEGTDEIIRTGRDGLLVPPADPNALADAIHAVLVDNDLRARVAKVGQARVRQEFTVNAMVSKVAQVYDQMLGVSGV